MLELLLMLVVSCADGEMQQRGSASQASSAERDVRAFVSLLQQKSCPTLRDYFTFIGEGTEAELRMELAVCREKGFSPSPVDKDCVEYTHRRAEISDEVPSFYLGWLKSIFPKTGPLAAVSVKEVKRPAAIAYQLIRARVGDVEVEFFRQLTSNGPFGRVDVASVGGAPVARLFAAELERREKRAGSRSTPQDEHE